MIWARSTWLLRVEGEGQREMEKGARAAGEHVPLATELVVGALALFIVFHFARDLALLGLAVALMLPFLCRRMPLGDRALPRSRFNAPGDRAAFP